MSLKLFGDLASGAGSAPTDAVTVDAETILASDTTSIIPSRFRGIPDSPDPLKMDFRLFLYKIWEFYGWVPSPLQLSLAYYLQHGPDRLIIMAFRGCSKSWITGAFALWCLYCNQDMKVMVLSGSQKRALAFTSWCANLIMELDFLKQLRPRPGQRMSALAFDVNGAKPDQTPSLNALGYNSQTAGWRADIIIPDDVETAQNSLTVLMREKILELVPEYEAILKPGGTIAFLGTPHSEDSTYVHLYKERGYECRIWPAVYPDAKMQKVYGERLAGYIRHELRVNNHLVGQSTEPARFTMEDLEKRRLGSTEAEFRLQYLLDTALADAEKYPLKASNLMVMALDEYRGPDYVVWGKAEDLTLKEVPSLGFDGDYYQKPMSVAENFTKWNSTKAFIDPAGGKSADRDEASMAIVSELHANVFLRYTNGWHEGFSPETLRAMATALVHYRVGYCLIESNFGDGMFLALLRPYVQAAWDAWNKTGPGKVDKDGVHGTEFEEKKAGVMQKELRILSIMEPVTAQHRLVVNRQVIEQDYASAFNSRGEVKLQFSLFYQFTHLTHERDSLKHDDRIEAVSEAVGLYADVLGVDPMGMAEKTAADRLEEELMGIYAEPGDTPVSRSGRVSAGSPRRR